MDLPLAAPLIQLTVTSEDTQAATSETGDKCEAVGVLWFVAFPVEVVTNLYYQERIPLFTTILNHHLSVIHDQLTINHDLPMM